MPRLASRKLEHAITRDSQKLSQHKFTVLPRDPGTPVDPFAE